MGLSRENNDSRKKHVMKILLIKSEIRIMIINLIFDANIRVDNSVRMIILSCAYSLPSPAFLMQCNLALTIF